MDLSCTEEGLESGKAYICAENSSDTDKGRKSVPIVPLTSMSSIQSKIKVWKEKYGKPLEPLPLPRSPSPKLVSREELEQNADGKSSIDELSAVDEKIVDNDEESERKEVREATKKSHDNVNVSNDDNDDEKKEKKKANTE